MAAVSSSRYLLPFFVLNLYLELMVADPNLTFSFENFGKDSNFESQLALFGDAKVANDGMSVQMTGSWVSSAGRVISKRPVSIVERNSRQMVSFSNYFVFSMSKENEDGLAFVMLPVGFPLNFFDGGPMGLLKERKFKFLAVEFDTFMDEKYGDANSNHVGLDVESPVSVKARNVSSVNLVLNSGERLQAWIDYEASSKTFEVRLSKFGESRPLDPLLSYPIDLSKMWKEEDVTVGLSSSSGKTSQKINLYSWSFKSRTTPRRMHSKPVDPDAFAQKGEEIKVTRRSGCPLRILAGLILGIGCGALVAFSVWYVWSVFRNRRPVVPEEFAGQPEEVECKTLSVSSGRTIEGDKK